MFGKLRKCTIIMLSMIFMIMGATLCVSAEGEEPVLHPEKITARYSGSVRLDATIDKSRFTVVAYYQDGSSRNLKTDEFDIFPTTVSDVGNNMITVTHKVEDTAVSVNSTVIGRSPSNLTGLSAEYSGEMLSTGDLIDRGDVKVIAQYGDGTTAEVDTWHFANYIIAGGTNIVYIVYQEDGYTRTCNIKVPGKTVSNKEIIKITARYTGDGVNSYSRIDSKDVQVSGYFKYISTTNVVTTSMEGVYDWWFAPYTIYSGTNTVTIYYKYGDTTVSTTVDIEGIGYDGNWIMDNGFYKFQLNNGKYLISDWYQENGVWYYFNDSGHMVTGWEDIDNHKYFFDKYGRMSVGWQYINNKWYYFNKSGDMAEGWVKDGLYWYYMDDETGEMTTSKWVKYRNRWYYMSLIGIMATGWFQDTDGVWYYLTGTGAMATGWYTVGDKWYYSNKDGSLATNTWIENYYVDHNGVWTQTREK